VQKGPGGPVVAMWGHPGQDPRNMHDNFTTYQQVDDFS